MSTNLSNLPNIVKVAREHAYLGLYQESLKNFDKALDIIQRHFKEINDKLLVSEWKKTQQSLLDEIEEVEKLNEIVLGNKPKRKIIRQNQQQKNDMYSNDEYQDKPKKKQAKYPFGGRKPFQKKGMDIEPQNNDFQVPNHIKIRDKKPNKKEEKEDPDVWSPPPSPPRRKKSKKSVNRPMNERERRRAYNPGNRGQGLGKPTALGRKYDKPWQKGIQKKKSKKKSKEDDDSFHNHVYPDGDGPDSHLIKMLEKDVLLKSPTITFDDIADLDTAKEILQEAVLLPLLMPEYFTGIRRPWKGVLMFGPPGTGKTLLAKAIASQGKTCFFNVHASTIASKWKGEAEKLVRLLFEMARFYAPSIVFFDEFDALAGSRGQGNEHESSRKVKSELLVQMDGMPESNSEQKEEEEKEQDVKSKLVMVLAASNIPWDLDEAIKRRLEKRIYIPLPSVKGRRKVFDINMKKMKVASQIDWDKLVNITEGYSGADIANVCREAAYMPMRRKLLKSGGLLAEKLKNPNQLKEEIDIPITQSDFEQALKNVQKSVSGQHLKKYENWMKEFGSK